MPLSEADALARAEAEVRAYCGWHIAPSRDETFALDGSDANVLMLPTLHMTDLLSLSVDDQTVEVSDDIEWSVAGYIRRGAAWTSRLRGVVVEITHGYDELPLDVTAVIERVSVRARELSESSQVLSQVGQVRYAVGVDGLRNVPLLSEADRFVLDRYRIPPRP